MKKNEEVKRSDRRGFLKLAGMSAPAAAVAVATGVSKAEAKTEDAGDRMQDTAHTRAYFESAKF